MNICQRVQYILTKEELTRGELVARIKLTDRQVDNALTRLIRLGVVGRNGCHPHTTYFSKCKVIEEGRGSAPASLENLKQSSKRGHEWHRKKLRPSLLRHPLDLAWHALVSPMTSGGGQE